MNLLRACSCCAGILLAMHPAWAQLGTVGDIVRDMEMRGRASGEIRPSYIEENRARLAALRAEEERLGEHSADLIPALHELADWYEDQYLWELALPLRRRAVTIIEGAYGVDDVRVVDPLLRLAWTYERERKYRTEGLKALERVVRLYDRAPGVDLATRADAFIELGNWHVLSGKYEEAQLSYARAWRALVASEEFSTQAAEQKLGRPQRLVYDAPDFEPAFSGHIPTIDAEAFAEVAFIVTPEGKVRNVKVIESNLSVKMNQRLRAAISHARYRPGLIYGEPAEMNARLRQSYRLSANDAEGDFYEAVSTDGAAQD